jgi:uncharacterized membrane protein YhiD involved in acid resistance
VLRPRPAVGRCYSGQHGVDPTRIAAYVVSGIGFLGAGVILRDGIHVRGINTAATIWCSAAIGVLAGAGYLPAAAIAAALILTAHLALRPLAQRVDRLPATADTEIQTTYQFRAVTRAADEAHIRTLLVRELTRDDFTLHSVQSHDLNNGTGQVEVTAELQAHGRDDLALEKRRQPPQPRTQLQFRHLDHPRARPPHHTRPIAGDQAEAIRRLAHLGAAANHLSV